MAISKDTILKEIRRIAETNEGVAPGSKRFESETGITESAWRGKYWEIWSNAVVEAGFEPNDKKLARPPEQLLSSLAQLTKERGQIPTQSQIQMKARSTAGFPWATAFRRLGNMTERIEKLLIYSRGKPGHESVVSICENALVSLHNDGEASAVSPEGDGFVYLLKSGRRYKFGFTKDLDQRIRQLAHQTSEPINKVHSIRTDDPSGVEAYWKRRFADKCVHNEWFMLTAKDVAAFKRRKKFM